MKKLIEKDKKIRQNIFINETKHFVLKSISKNFNFFKLIRWNACLKLKNLTKKASKSSTTNRCLRTTNKKRFNKFTGLSRHVYLKCIRSGSITGIKKASW